MFAAIDHRVYRYGEETSSTTKDGKRDSTVVSSSGINVGATNEIDAVTTNLKRRNLLQRRRRMLQNLLIWYIQRQMSTTRRRMFAG